MRTQQQHASKANWNVVHTEFLSSAIFFVHNNRQEKMKNWPKYPPSSTRLEYYNGIFFCHFFLRWNFLASLYYPLVTDGYCSVSSAMDRIRISSKRTLCVEVASDWRIQWPLSRNFIMPTIVSQVKHLTLIYSMSYFFPHQVTLFIWPKKEFMRILQTCVQTLIARKSTLIASK